MRIGRGLFAAIFLSSSMVYALSAMQPDEQAAAALVVAANESRAAQGLPPLREDPELTRAAFLHAQRMVAEGALSHQFSGEPGLIQRVQQVGVRCSSVAENVAAGPAANRIHNEWMHSPPHRANLLDPQLNTIGIAVINDHGVLYAVEDFAREVTAMNASQQERQVASLLALRGLQVQPGGNVAHAYCNGSPAHPHPLPHFIMRYSTTDLSRLPAQVQQGVDSGRFRSAQVAACNAAEENGFRAYQIVLLLY